ncbi:MAG: hypothetical protein AAGK97_02195 [Bacteroidota bacterium]
MSTNNYKLHIEEIEPLPGTSHRWGIHSRGFTTKLKLSEFLKTYLVKNDELGLDTFLQLSSDPTLSIKLFHNYKISENAALEIVYKDLTTRYNLQQSRKTYEDVYQIERIEQTEDYIFMFKDQFEHIEGEFVRSYEDQFIINANLKTALHLIQVGFQHPIIVSEALSSDSKIYFYIDMEEIKHLDKLIPALNDAGIICTKTDAELLFIYN